jgi:hypothetical protein
LESEHRHKALVESGMRELKENFGLEVLRKHQFMANWAWLLIVVTAHNLIRLTQLLGRVEPDADLRGKRFRYRYLVVPGLLVRSGRRLSSGSTGTTRCSIVSWPPTPVCARFLWPAPD